MLPFSAVILAGGEGTRIRELFPSVPKCMIEFGGHPFLRYLISWFVRSGCPEIIITTGCSPTKVNAEFNQDFWRAHGVRVISEPQRTGTGGATRFAAELSNQDHIFLCNGDTVIECDLQALWQCYQTLDMPAATVVTLNDGVPNQGAITVLHNRVIAFREGEPTLSAHDQQPVETYCASSTGAYFLKRSLIRECFPESTSSLECERIPGLVRRGCLGAINNGHAFFLDFGVPERYAQLAANEHVLRRIYGEPIIVPTTVEKRRKE